MSVVDGLPFDANKKKYILEVLDPLLEEMVSDVLTEMPKSPHDFMIQWLRKRSGVAMAGKVSIAAKNKNLKQELVQITGSLKETGTAIAHGKKSDDPPEEEEEEDEDDDCDEIPEHLQKSEAQLGRARQSVSAEAYGDWNKKKDFTPPSHPKNDDQKSRLKATLTKSFMFSELHATDFDTILMAMKEVPLTAGTKVITEGEDGDYLFVIESGTLDCLKNIEGSEKVVKTCNAGDVFGELAVLYNCPRAASVVAKDNCICWQLDRETVNHIVKDASVKRRNKYDNFLQQVTLISGLNAYERSQIADALKPESFKKGDTIVKELDPGDKFYIVEDGALYASKKLQGGDEKRVMNYKSGDYFGELALLKNQPRAASIIVESETAQVLSMSRVSFTKMLGPLQHLLAARADVYENVEANK
jgi:cAMP-dependent protein kinase regulator